VVNTMAFSMGVVLSEARRVDPCGRHEVVDHLRGIGGRDERHEVRHCLADDDDLLRRERPLPRGAHLHAERVQQPHGPGDCSAQPVPTLRRLGEGAGCERVEAVRKLKHARRLKVPAQGRCRRRRRGGWRCRGCLGAFASHAPSTLTPLATCAVLALWSAWPCLCGHATDSMRTASATQQVAASTAHVGDGHRAEHRHRGVQVPALVGPGRADCVDRRRLNRGVSTPDRWDEHCLGKAVNVHSLRSGNSSGGSGIVNSVPQVLQT
jgi:hypothetical protein